MLDYLTVSMKPSKPNGERKVIRTQYMAPPWAEGQLPTVYRSDFIINGWRRHWVPGQTNVREEDWIEFVTEAE